MDQQVLCRPGEGGVWRARFPGWQVTVLTTGSDPPPPLSEGVHLLWGALTGGNANRQV